MTASLTRLTPETLTINTWSQGLLYGLGGLVVAVLLAAVVGVLLRISRHRSTWLGVLTVTPLLAAFLAWAMGYTRGSSTQVHHVSRAAAIIRAARKNLDVDYGRIGDPATRESDLLLWAALNCTATAALVGTHERKSYHLRAAEACLRTWRETQR